MQTTDPKKSTTEIRQADRHRGTLWVLLVGVVVVGVVFALMWWFYAMHPPALQ